VPTARGKRRKNKVIVIIFFPVLIFLATIGYFAYSVDFLRRKTKPKAKETTKRVEKDGGLTFYPTFSEKQEKLQH